ncbi:hypothetical protein ACFLXC_04860 [Chloroflexota bacterium]
MERKDGIRRNFKYDWQEVARCNPDYRAHVESEKARLGGNHPLFMTQYRLLPVHGGGRFFSPQQRAQMQGSHSRRRQPQAGKVYIAGIDLAGEAEKESCFTMARQRRDSTVVTIGEADIPADDVLDMVVVKIVEHYRWAGVKHTDLYPRLVDILKRVWRCRKIVVDASGVGQSVASFLRKALGSRLIPFTFTSSSKSELGFNLLSAVNAGRLKVYKGDGSAEYRDFWLEMERAKSVYRPNQTMTFYVDPSEGHDDFLMSLALAVEAADRY